jgi:methyl-accepting chemotaxis protein
LTQKDKEIMRLSIRKKLLFLFAVIIAFQVATFGIGYYALNALSDASDYVHDLSKENSLWHQWKEYQQKETINILAYISTTNERFIEEAQIQADYALAVEEELGKIVPDSRKDLYDKVSKEAAQVLDNGMSAVYSFQRGYMEVYNSSIAIWEANDNQIIADIDAAIEESDSEAQEALVAANANKWNSTNLMFIICAIAFIFSITTSLFFTQKISGSVNSVKKALQKMAKGDLTSSIKRTSSDEIGDMVNAYNDMQSNFSKLISDLKNSSLQLASASQQLAESSKQSSESTQQVASSSQQMARGAQEQSTNAQETSKSISQLSEAINQLAKGAQEQSQGVQQAVDSITEVASTIAKVSDNAAKAAEGAKLASDSAQTGASKSNLTLQGMERIKEVTSEVAKKIEQLGVRSGDIGKIVSVIDEIASQTNLLALNAAIEAARAGEQGKGFAVVSDEVRKLAERTASATKEIVDLITSVQQGVNEATEVMSSGITTVNEGYNLAVESGESLNQIFKVGVDLKTQIESISSNTKSINNSTDELVKVIDSVGSITEENTAATEEMSASAEQISKSVETVAGIAEENSAATEEVSASAEEMSAQVEEIVASSQTLKDMAEYLEQSIAKFKVNELSGENNVLITSNTSETENNTDSTEQLTIESELVKSLIEEPVPQEIYSDTTKEAVGNK